MKQTLAIVLAVVSLCSIAIQAPGAEQVFKPREANGPAPTPPMGWNSWNKYGCDISKAIIRNKPTPWSVPACRPPVAGSLTAEIAPHAVLMLKVTPARRGRH